MVKVSIITVVYNGAKTIRRTLESVCKQTILPYEYIIIDGLSTDSTLEIVKEYLANYPFIKYISEKDSGIYDAMNKGIDVATGELVGIINSDDWYEFNALETMTNSYSKYGSGVYYGIQRNILEDKEYFLERANHEFIALKMIPHPSTFVSSDIYKQKGNFNLNFKYSADLDLIIRFLNEHVPFYRVDSIISNFRIGGVSSSYSAGNESLLIRKQYKLISDKQYYFKILKTKLKSLLRF